MTASMNWPHLMTDARFNPVPRPEPKIETVGPWYRDIRPRARDWMPTLTDRLLDLSRLPLAWDGGAGRPVDSETIGFAHRLLQSLCDVGVAEPVVVPTSSGGLQIEWHDDSTEIDLELSTDRTSSVFVWMQDESGNEQEYEGELRSGADFLGRALARIDAAADTPGR